MKKAKKVGDGPASFYVTTVPTLGVVTINFDHPVSWFAVTPDVAKQLGEDLVRNADELKKSKRFSS